MRTAFYYLIAIFAIIMFLASLSAFVLMNISGMGIIAYAETMRYVSNIGKVLMFLLGSGAAFFLVEFILAPWRNR